MYNPDKLEEYAQKIYARYEYFNNYTLETIANRIKKTGELSAYDRQALKNTADITGDMDVITKKLAQITRMNIADIENVYKQVVTDGVNTYKPLYDFKGIKFVPFEQNEYAQQLVRHWAKETAGTMVNLSRTKALCFDKTDARGNVVGSVPLKGAYEQAIAEAVTAVTSGTTEFNTAMARTVERLGGSGVKVTYGSGVNRSLPAMMRQNLLYGAKQAAQSYDEYIGQELGCDGFEVDAHSGCRPTHMFMQGKMYSYNGRKVINGVAYEDGAEALDRLHDYGCLHFKTDVILGVSVPRYSKAELERIHRETTELIEYGGREKTLYEWKQTQRALERGVRNEQQKADVFDAAGMKRRAQNCRDRVKAYRDKYEDMCKNVKGIEPRLDRMRTYKAKANVDISGGSDIIKIHQGKQDKHIRGTNNYVEGKSYLTVSNEEIERIIKSKSGTGKKVGNKEQIVADKIIGVNVNTKCGFKTLTDTAHIHSSKDGQHLVPTHTQLRAKSISELNLYAKKMAMEYYDMPECTKWFGKMTSEEKEQRIELLLSQKTSKTALIKDIKSMERKILKYRGDIK